MNEEWFTQTNVCKPNFTVHHYFTFNPRTVNRRSCYNLVLKLSRVLARGAMAKPSDRLSNLRNPWVEVLVFWSSMRAPSMKPPWWHTAGWLNPHPAIAPQWPTDGSWSILLSIRWPGPRTNHQPLAFLLLVLVEFSNFDIDFHQYSVMVSSPCNVERRGCLNTETGALVGQKRYL